MHHSFLDMYSDRQSPVHRTNAQAKIVCLVVFLVGIVSITARHIYLLPIIAAVLIILWFLAKLPFIYFLKRLLIACPFVIFISASAAYSQYKFKGLNPYLVFTLLSCKAALAVGAVSLVMSTTPYQILLLALKKFGMPKIILNLVSFFYRFAYILIDEFERLETGIKSREFNRKLRLAWRARAWGLGTFFIRSIERSDRVYQAMCARGYNFFEE